MATLNLVHPADRVRAETALPAVILQFGVPVALPTPDERGSFARERHDGPDRILTALSLFARSIEGEANGHQGTVGCATLPVPPPGSPPIGRDGVAVRAVEGRR